MLSGELASYVPTMLETHNRYICIYNFIYKYVHLTAVFIKEEIRNLRGPWEELVPEGKVEIEHTHIGNSQKNNKFYICYEMQIFYYRNIFIISPLKYDPLHM